jgi:FixJ family two-component response regulator
MYTPPVRTVGVIDDDRRVLTSIANLLASGGYGTRIYETADAFLAVDHSDLACVITDLGMRPIDGLQVLQRIAQSPSPVPVIIITGRPSEYSDDYFLRLGAVGFFRKPVDGDALLERLSDVI